MKIPHLSCQKPPPSHAAQLAGPTGSLSMSDVENFIPSCFTPIDGLIQPSKYMESAALRRLKVINEQTNVCVLQAWLRTIFREYRRRTATIRSRTSVYCTMDALRILKT